MWIRDFEGDLVNLDHYKLIKVEEVEAGDHGVFAFDGEEQALFLGTATECERFMEQIVLRLTS